MSDESPQILKAPTTGVHILPPMTNPVIKGRSDNDRVIAIEMTPIDQNGEPTGARFQMPIHREDALLLATMIADLAMKKGWMPPEGTLTPSSIQ
jgi:hypothetical protein